MHQLRPSKHLNPLNQWNRHLRATRPGAQRRAITTGEPSTRLPGSALDQILAQALTFAPGRHTPPHGAGGVCLRTRMVRALHRRPKHTVCTDCIHDAHILPDLLMDSGRQMPIGAFAANRNVCSPPTYDGCSLPDCHIGQSTSGLRKVNPWVVRLFGIYGGECT